MSATQSNPDGGRVLVIRHGHTAGNQARYLGWEDEPLDAVGEHQSRRLAAALAGERIDRICSSPLRRAVDTARPLAAARGLQIEIDDGLKEIHFGDYQGESKSRQSIRLRRDHCVVPVPGGESLADLYRRTAPIATRLRDAAVGGQHLAAVGHYWSNRMLAAALCDIPFAEVFATPAYKPANASLLEIRFEARGAAASVRCLITGGDDLR